VFQREFDRRYGPGSQPGGGAHPLWLPELLSAGHAFGWGAMHQMQKLLEAAMTTHVPTILAAAKGLSRPGVYHQIQMDMYGRTTSDHKAQMHSATACHK
jgi:hypothetical protein